MRLVVGELNWQANLLKHSWQTQKMISEPSETHRIVISLATETPLLEGVGQRQSFLYQKKMYCQKKFLAIHFFSGLKSLKKALSLTYTL